jgi:hypothetical protein
MARQQRKSISRAPVDVDHQVVVAEIDHLATGPRVAADSDHPATDPRVVADSDLREVLVVTARLVKALADLQRQSNTLRSAI